MLATIATTVAGVAVGLAAPALAGAQATCSSTATIACGEVATGNVSAVGQTDCFDVTAVAGEVVTVLAKSTTAGMEACAQLRDPDGAVLGPDACGQTATFTLPKSGTYSLRLFDRSNDETGSYAVQFQVLSATASSCPAATVPCGATPSGILTSGVDSDTYRIVAAEAGEVVSITSADSGASFEACWQLYAADGNAIGPQHCNQDTRTLPAAGPYTIRVFDLGNDETGAYRLDVNVVSATAGHCREATLLCGAAQEGGIAVIGDNDVYWFTTTTSNEVVDITTATTSGSLHACWQVYDAGGTSVGNISCGNDQRVLITPGTYVVRVFDLAFEAAGTYELSAATSPACPATPTPSPSSTPNGEPTSGGSGTATPAESPSSGATPTSDGLATPTGAGTGTPSTGGAPTSTPSAGASGSGGTPTPQRTPSVESLEAVLDDFLCYATRLTRGGPGFTPALGVRLSDPLESLTFDVKKPIELCAAADKDGNGIVDAATSVQRYRLQRTRGAPRHTRSTRSVATSLGTLSLDTIRPEHLLVPTAQSDVGTPALPDAAHRVDRYKCYRVRVTRKTPKLPFDLQVTVTDGMSTPNRRFKVKSPTRLCLATSDEPDRVHNPGGHLLCYPVRLIRGEAKHVKQRGLYLGNELGPTRVDTFRESQLCLPAVFVP